MGALPRTLSVLALTALITTTAACSGSSGPPTPTTTTAAESLADVAPPPAERCRKPDDGTVAKAVVTASDGIELAAAEWGEGPRGIVLLHQQSANLCGWWEYATELAAHGFHLLAIDFRGNGMSAGGAAADDLTLDTVAAVEWLKAAGATTIVLMGASMGATTAMVTVGRNPELVDGLVTLSLPPPIDVTDGNGPEPTTPQAAAPLVDVPLLMCWANRDGSAINPQPLIDAAPSTTKQVVTRDGTAHGWGLLTDGAVDVRPEVLAFLEEHV